MEHGLKANQLAILLDNYETALSALQALRRQCLLRVPLSSHEQTNFDGNIAVLEIEHI